MGIGYWEFGIRYKVSGVGFEVWRRNADQYHHIFAVVGLNNGQSNRKKNTLIHSTYYKMWERFPTAIYLVGLTLTAVPHKRRHWPQASSLIEDRNYVRMRT